MEWRVWYFWLHPGDFFLNGVLSGKRHLFWGDVLEIHQTVQCLCLDWSFSYLVVTASAVITPALWKAEETDPCSRLPSPVCQIETRLMKKEIKRLWSHTLQEMVTERDGGRRVSVVKLLLCVYLPICRVMDGVAPQLISSEDVNNEGMLSRQKGAHVAAFFYSDHQFTMSLWLEKKKKRIMKECEI